MCSIFQVVKIQQGSNVICPRSNALHFVAQADVCERCQLASRRAVRSSRLVVGVKIRVYSQFKLTGAFVFCSLMTVLTDGL